MLLFLILVVRLLVVGVLETYMRLWQYQQQNRPKLVEASLQWWSLDGELLLQRDPKLQACMVGNRLDRESDWSALLRAIREDERG